MQGDSTAKAPAVAIVTNNLICELNSKYFSRLEKYFSLNGWVIRNDFEVDRIVFSTCGLSDSMMDIVKNALGQLAGETFPTEKIIVMGCLPKTHETELQKVFQGKIINFGEEEQLDRMIEAKIPFREIDGTNVFRRNELFNIQVSDGCLRECTYCVIKKAHGILRSIPVADIEKQFRGAIRNGYRKINLVGVDTLGYGYDTGSNIVELMEYLLTIEPQVTFYLGSIHIKWLELYGEGFFNLCKRGLIKSLHFGLQHVNQEILKKMGRKGNFAAIYADLRRLKDECPDLFISGDIIIGFPGETDEIFNEVMEFFKKDRCFSLINNFEYSDVQGAAAIKLPNKVSPAKRVLRWAELNEVLGDRLPNLALKKHTDIEFNRYRDAYERQNEMNYYFCKNSYVEME